MSLSSFFYFYRLPQTFPAILCLGLAFFSCQTSWADAGGDPNPTATRNPHFVTESPTDTPTFIPTPTFTFVMVEIPTATFTLEPVHTDTPTSTNTLEPVQPDTPTSTNTPEPVHTDTPTSTNTLEPSPTPVFTETYTDTPVEIMTATPTVEEFLTPTWTNTAVEIPTAIPTQTPVTPEDTPTEIPAATNTAVETPTDIPSDPPTQTPGISVTDSPTDLSTDTPVVTPTPTVCAVTEGPAAQEGSTSVTLTWASQCPGFGRVLYGLDPLHLNGSQADPHFTQSHSVVISNLNPGQNYSYRVLVLNQDGILLAQSEVSGFTTVAFTPTLTPTVTATPTSTFTKTPTFTPTVCVMTQGPAVQTGASKAVFTWASDCPGFGAVRVGLNPSRLTGLLMDPHFTPAHSVTLSNVSPGLTYYYNASVLNQDGIVVLQSPTLSFSLTP